MTNRNPAAVGLFGQASALLTLVLTAGIAASGYEETVQAKGGDAAVVRLQIDAVKIPLSGAATATITVEGPAPVQVAPIAALTPSKLWEATPRPPEVADLPGGRQRWRQSFRLEPLGPGSPPLPLAPLRYRAGKESAGWLEHHWKDVAIEVTTRVVEPEVKHVRGTSVIETLPEPPPWPRWPLVAAGILAGLAMLVAIRRRPRRPPHPVPELAPDQWALAQIDQIVREGLHASRQVELFHRLLCDVLRAYLERRFQLPASHQTTEEFLTTLRGSTRLGAEAQDLLRDFLQRCDLAKFARAEFSAEECQASAERARAFVGESGRFPAAVP